MKKYFLLILIIIIGVLCIPHAGICKNDDEKLYYDFTNDMEKFDHAELNAKETDIHKSDDLIKDIINKGKTYLFNEIKNSWIMFLKIIIICFLSSLIKIYVSDHSFGDIAFYGCYCLAAYVMIDNFKIISELCSKNINELSDFMKVAVPTYASALAMSGYASSAGAVQGIFMGVAVFITQTISKFFIPLLYCCGLVAVVSSISTVVNLSKFVTLISKTVKYSMGFLMIVFAGALTLSGFSTASVDNMAIKTAKYAVAKFVPVVGGCLSEALHSVINSSSVSKNSMGYVCFITLISMCMFPVLKTALSLFVFRITASASDMVSDNKIGNMINSVADVISCMVGLLLLTIVMFVLMIGIVASVG